MKEAEKLHFLEKLDAERLKLAETGEVVAREFSPDLSECRIVALHPNQDNIVSIISTEKLLAKKNNYALEWKVYEHDLHGGLGDCLLSEGFKADDKENVLVYPIKNLSFQKINELVLPPGSKIERVINEHGLEYLAEISRQIGRRDVDREKNRLSEILKTMPESLSIFVLSLNKEPVSCLRMHYPSNSIFAELAGARTKSTHRRKGFFTALVVHSLREVAKRRRKAVLVDALPTSETILKELGFEFLTTTQPFQLKTA